MHLHQNSDVQFKKYHISKDEVGQDQSKNRTAKVERKYEQDIAI